MCNWIHNNQTFLQSLVNHATQQDVPYHRIPDLGCPSCILVHTVTTKHFGVYVHTKVQSHYIYKKVETNCKGVEND